jgi:hypothetical protein
MHPTLARFLDVGKALELIERGAAGNDPDAAALVRASRADPGLTEQLRAAKGAAHPGPDAQQALVVLAVRAAVERLADDATLGPLARAAEAALKREGASDAEVGQMLGTVLLEEGFSDEGDPDDFDRPFVGPRSTPRRSTPWWKSSPARAPRASGRWRSRPPTASSPRRGARGCSRSPPSTSRWRSRRCGAKPPRKTSPCW